VIPVNNLNERGREILIGELKKHNFFRNLSKVDLQIIVESGSYEKWPASFKNGHENWIERNQNIITNCRALEFKSNITIFTEINFQKKEINR